MNSATFARFESLLEARERELVRSLSNRLHIAVENSPDELDNLSLASERELAVLTLDRGSRTLREVRAALERMRDGTYGICERCDEPIKPKRLEALPWARYCVSCQDHFDRGGTPLVPMAA